MSRLFSHELDYRATPEQTASGPTAAIDPAEIRT